MAIAFAIPAGSSLEALGLVAAAIVARRVIVLGIGLGASAAVGGRAAQG